MSVNLIQVVGAVVDVRQLTLYKSDGTTFTIPQGDPRVARIVSEITPVLSSGNGAVATVDVSTENHYSRYETRSLSMVKLFRIAKAALGALLNAEESKEKVQPRTIGSTNLEDAIAQIMKNAIPASSPDFHSDGLATQDSDETVVALVDGKIVSGVENLESQMANASREGNSTVGLDNFLRRVASVPRQHSVDDLLNFMKRGDLPIADDGSIVIYKALRRKGDGYVDIHSGRVTQKVGSLVIMDESLVDHDRRNECSNGLHVARRQYLRGFPGDVCVLAKVNPEDAIAVPEYDANKMRVCAYHILCELPEEGYKALMRNEPFTSNGEAQKLLGSVIAGNHVGILEEVRITGDRGTGLIITPRVIGAPRVAPPLMEERLAQAITDAEDKPTGPMVDVKSVAQQVQAAKAQSRADKAQGLYMEYLDATNETDAQKAAQALLDYKRTAKVSWEKLGFSSDITNNLKSDGAE